MALRGIDFHDEGGMTLLELLVAMAAAGVVVAALYGLLGTSISQQSRLGDQLQADGTGRATLSRMVEELHSSCTGLIEQEVPTVGAKVPREGIEAPAMTPKEGLVPSGPESLWFISTYGTGSSAEAVPSAEMHNIAWTASSAGGRLGTLTEYTFSANGQPPNLDTAELRPAVAAHKRVLSEDVLEPEGGIFHYYRSVSGQVSGTPLETPLTVASAREVVKVTISFAQAPESGDLQAHRAIPLADSVLLRFGPTEPTATDANAPCT